MKNYCPICKKWSNFLSFGYKIKRLKAFYPNCGPLDLKERFRILKSKKCGDWGIINVHLSNIEKTFEEIGLILTNFRQFIMDNQTI